MRAWKPQETEYKQEQGVITDWNFGKKKSRSGVYDLRNGFVCLRFLASTESGCSFHGAHTRILFKGTPLVPRGNIEIWNNTAPLLLPNRETNAFVSA